MDKTYWENYYRKHSRPDAPSLFAEFVLGHYLKPSARLIEMGCGNGRDSVFFSRNGVQVLGVDQVNSEIEFLNKTYANENLEFGVGDFTRMEVGEMYDCVYSRFTLHSIPEDDELMVLKWVFSSLNEGGLFFIEVRSVNDPKLQEGERISDCENIVDGHYRRYIELDGFFERLSALGFEGVYQAEEIGFAPYASENPPVIRVVVKRIAGGNRA